MEKLTRRHPESKGTDIVADNIEKLKALFPEIITEDNEGQKIDFDTLRAILGDAVTDKEERYSFTWYGKASARQLSQSPSTATLRSCRKDSIHWDTTRNLFIEGDNLEALKLLQKSYRQRVKLIYIDPPYNTGKEFIYNDKFQDNLQTYLRNTGQSNKPGLQLSDDAETAGRYHTNWLNMIYPRLRLARNLLSKDGIIIVHIDEHEHCNLEKLLNEIYGEENNLGTIVWDKRNPKGDAKSIACQHEYIVIYAKNRSAFAESGQLKRPKQNAKRILDYAKRLIAESGTVNERVRKLFKEWIAQQDFSVGEKAYCHIDDAGNVYRPVSMAWPNKRKAPDEYFTPLIHPVTGKPCPVPARGWRNPPNTMRQLQESGLILFGKDDSTIPNRKYLLKDNLTENTPSLLYYAGSDDALFDELGLRFDNPKPLAVSKSLIASIVNSHDESIVLDFFAGSCTTAHSVLSLNSEDGGNRRFIVIQLPEPINKKAKHDTEYSSIADIGKQRIRIAGQAIKKENTTYSGDIGFKAFKLSSSNIALWKDEIDSLEQEQALCTDPIKPDRTAEDVLYEILLKYGLDLTLPIKEHYIAGKTIYNVGAGALMVCLDNAIHQDVVQCIGNLKKELKPEIMRVVFKDSGFANDAAKRDAVQILKQFGIDDIKSI